MEKTENIFRCSTCGKPLSDDMICHLFENFELMLHLVEDFDKYSNNSIVVGCGRKDCNEMLTEKVHKLDYKYNPVVEGLIIAFIKSIHARNQEKIKDLITEWRQIKDKHYYDFLKFSDLIRKTGFSVKYMPDFLNNFVMEMESV